MFEASDTERWCMVQETVCSHYISVKPEKDLAIALSHRRGFS